MKSRILILFFVLHLSATASAQAWQARSDWARFFADAGVKGTIVILDERAKAHWVYGEDRA